jgi:microsomal epoxide hydrolase
VEKWTAKVETPEFVVDDVWCGMVASLGFSGTVSAETTTFWKEAVKSTYVGDEGRKKVRMASMNLLSRDGLLLRLQDIKCPVYWLQVSFLHGLSLHPRHLADLLEKGHRRCSIRYNSAS